MPDEKPPLDQEKISRIWQIIYPIEDTIYDAGPFRSYKEAISWARCSDKSTSRFGDDEFDILTQHVYVMGPDRRLVELSIADIIDEDAEEEAHDLPAA